MVATHSVNGNALICRQISNKDYSAISLFLESLSDDSKRRFGPHAYDVTSMTDFYANHPILGFVAENTCHAIVAYMVVKRGFWLHDEFRYVGYGLTMSQQTDATLAPAVADNYQGSGVGFELLKFTLAYLKNEKVERVFLWGGVQADNQKAIRFYERNGFVQLGGFEYHGYNYDMVLELI